MPAFVKKDRISDDKQRVSLLISKDMYAKVKELAADEEISANEFMIRAIALSMNCSQLNLASIQRQIDSVERRYNDDINKIKMQIQALAKISSIS